MLIILCNDMRSEIAVDPIYVWFQMQPYSPPFGNSEYFHCEIEPHDQYLVTYGTMNWHILYNIFSYFEHLIPEEKAAFFHVNHRIQLYLAVNLFRPLSSSLFAIFFSITIYGVWLLV